MWKKIILSLAAALLLPACSDAKMASYNLSKASDQFEVTRRVVFFNGITDKYLLSIEGLCSFEHGQRKVAVTCKDGDDSYKKHYLGLSDNVSYIIEQMDSIPVSVYHYRVIFKPQAILPDIDFEGSLGG